MEDDQHINDFLLESDFQIVVLDEPTTFTFGEEQYIAPRGWLLYLLRNSSHNDCVLWGYYDKEKNTYVETKVYQYGKSVLLEDGSLLVLGQLSYLGGIRQK